MTVSVQGPAVFDDTNLVIQAARNGPGLGLGFEEQVAELMAKRRLIRVLEDWCTPFPGFFLYNPSRRNQPAALPVQISTLRPWLGPLAQR